MATVDLGRAFPVSHGDWTSGGGTGTGGAYERLSIVRHLGKTWISAVETTEEPTVDATDWNIMVEDTSTSTGFKNYIINGDFDVWQRGTSQTCTSAAYQYSSVDRFCLINLEATNYTISRVSVNGTEPFSASYFARNVVPLNTTTGIVLDQHIENLKRFSNKTVTLSMWVKGGAGKKIGFGYQAVYGTGGTPSAPDNILGKIFILTGSWQKVVMTTTLPDVITGKTYGTNDDNLLRLSIAFSSGTNTYVPEIFFQSGTFDIAQVQLEEGPVATPFENRPYGLELALCRRYFERRRLVVFAPVTTTIYGGSVPVHIENIFRVSPSFSVNSVLSNSNWVGSLIYDGGIVFSSTQQTTAGAYIDTICDLSAEL